MEKHVLNEAAAPAQGQQMECQECERLRSLLDASKRVAGAVIEERDQALAELSALKAQQVGQESVAWGAFHFGGSRNGKLYTHCETEQQIESYIADLHRSNDSITLRKAPLYTAPQPAPAQDVAGWIPVTERLPEVETDVLVRGVRRNEVMHRVAGLFNGEWSSQETEDLLLGEVTHWMPLPAAPALSAAQAGGGEG